MKNKGRSHKAGSGRYDFAGMANCKSNIIKVSEIGVKSQIQLNVGSVNKLLGESCPVHEVYTIDDLYQIATEENLQRIMLDLKATFAQLLSMEAKTSSKAKLSIKSFKWIDDWSEKDKADHKAAISPHLAWWESLTETEVEEILKWENVYGHDQGSIEDEIKVYYSKYNLKK